MWWDCLSSSSHPIRVMFTTKRHSTTMRMAKCHHPGLQRCLGAETWPKNEPGQGTGGGRKLGFIDPLFHIVNCSGIWNPPPRDLLHKQKILGKSPRPARDAFMSSELFFMELNYFWALRPRHLKDLAFFWPELLALLSPFFYFTDLLKWRLNIFQQEFIE